MSDVVGWVVVGLVVGSPAIFVIVSYLTQRRRPRPGDRAALSSSGLLGFDELLNPSARDARLIWEADQELPTPAPTPDGDLGILELGHRIIVQLPEAGGGRDRRT